METSWQSASPVSPPRPFRLTAPDRLELKEGGGCLALFGLPFFATGVMLAFTAVGIVPTQGQSSKWTPLALGAMSVVFTSVGAILVFGRQWLFIDLTRRSVIRQYGLLVPFRTHERLLSEFNAIVVTHDRGDSDSPQRFPVRLRAVKGQDFVINKPAQFGESLTQAEYLAVLLRLPLVDTTTDHESVVDSGKGVVNLSERAFTTALTPARRPDKMRAVVTETVDSTTVVIPGGGSWFSGALGIVFPLFMLLIFLPALLRFFSRTHTPHYVQYGFSLFLILLFVLPTLLASVNLIVGSQRKRTTVTATAKGLTIEERAAWRKRSRFVPSVDLLDIDCSTIGGAIESVKASRGITLNPDPRTERLLTVLKKYLPSQGIIVKTRTELLTFGQGLPAGELQYLVWVLRQSLRGHDPERVTKVSGAPLPDGV